MSTYHMCKVINLCMHAASFIYSCMQVVLHKTIESMLERGEKLDALVDKSTDLSMASQMFYKQARKTNSCCKMM